MLRLFRVAGTTWVDESAQPSGSFKWRGVISQARAVVPGRELVTFSSGNHGAAVAAVGLRMGAKTTVVVPEWVDADKRRLLASLRARVVVSGTSASGCELVARAEALAGGGVLVHPYRSAHQLAGYGSLWAELAAAFPSGAEVIVPVGAGGLLAAGVAFRAEARARLTFVGVEPRLCASVLSGIRCGRPERVDTRSEFASGLNVDSAPEEVLAILRGAEGLEMAQVSDEEMAVACVVASRAGFAIDHAAAAGVAWALFHPARRGPWPRVVVITGRGCQVAAARLLQEGLLSRGAYEYATSAGARVSSSRGYVIPANLTARINPRALSALAGC